MEVASVGGGLELKAEPKTSTKSAPLLIAVTAIGLVLGLAGLALPRVVGPRDEYAGDRQAALTRASDFAVTFNTYSTKNKADYQRRMKPLMTKSYYKGFAKITNVMFTVMKDKNQRSGDARVLSMAVDTIDHDSASVIAAIDSSVYTNESKAAVAHRFRWQISLRKVGSRWLVSEFDSTPPIEATVADVTQGSSKGSAQ